jgi:TRAP-type transport system periplasmic protein
MRRYFTVCIICAVVACLVSLAPKGNAAEIQLKYAGFTPATHQISVLADQWCKEVEKRTSGRVKVTYFPGATLTSATNTYDAVVKGIAHIGWSAMGYTRGKFPVSEVIDLPLGYQNGLIATKMANEYYKQFKPKEFNDVKMLYLHAHGPGVFHTKKEVNKLEDLKGLKIRSHGLSAKIVEALGAIPVGMPMNEAYDALQRGVAEGIVTNVGTLSSMKIGEVVSHTIENYGSSYSTGFFVVMNKGKWSGLPADVQKTIEQINQEWIEKQGRLWDEMDQEGREFGTKRGIKFVKLTKQEDARWAEKVKPLLNQYAKEMKEKQLPGDDVLKFCLNYLKANQK